MTVPQETQTWRQLRDRVERFKSKLGPRWRGEPEQLRRLQRGTEVLLQQIETAGEANGWDEPAKGELAETLQRSEWRARHQSGNGL
jgi:hypothetical protein